MTCPPFPTPFRLTRTSSRSISSSSQTGTLRSVSRARKFLAAGKLDKAQAEISRALRESPRWALALDTQGAIHLRTGDFDAAAIEFQGAIDADPTLGQAYVGLGMLLIARSRFKDALIPLDRAQALLPTSWLVSFETAIAHLQLGDFKGSLKQLDMTEKLAGSSANRKSGTALLRALALIRLGDYGGATRNMQDAIRFEPAGSYAKLAQAKIEEMKPFLDPERGALASNNQHP